MKEFNSNLYQTLMFFFTQVFWCSTLILFCLKNSQTHLVLALLLLFYLWKKRPLFIWRWRNVHNVMLITQSTYFHESLKAAAVPSAGHERLDLRASCQYWSRSCKTEPTVSSQSWKHSEGDADHVRGRGVPLRSQEFRATHLYRSSGYFQVGLDSAMLWQ